MGHKHLNYLKRYQILALLKAGLNQTQIAKETGVHKSYAPKNHICITDQLNCCNPLFAKNN